MTNRAELQAYLDRPPDDLMDELSLYAPTERSPADVWAKIAGPLRQPAAVRRVGLPHRPPGCPPER